MADVFNPQQRSAVMRGVAGYAGNEGARAAHALGLRFRLHRSDLPGSPDLVFPRRNKPRDARMAGFGRYDRARGADAAQNTATTGRPKISRNRARDKASLAAL